MQGSIGVFLFSGCGTVGHVSTIVVMVMIMVVVEVGVARV